MHGDALTSAVTFLTEAKAKPSQSYKINYLLDSIREFDCGQTFPGAFIPLMAEATADPNLRTGLFHSFYPINFPRIITLQTL